MNQLTDRQAQVLEFISSFQDKYGRTPSGPEVADHFGYKDPSSVYQHLDLIEKKGYLEVTQPKQRAPLQITLTETGKQATEMSWPIYGEIPAGPLSEASSDETVEVQSLEDLLPMIEPGDYFLTVSGDSMIGAGLKEGMTLLMRPTDNPAKDVKDGDICAVWIQGDGGTLKRVFYKNGSVRLVPENDQYQERSYPPERVSIQGFLVAALSVLPFRID